MRHAVAHQRQAMCSQFTRKPLVPKILKVSFGSYKGPLQIPIDIGPMSLILHAVNR